MGDLFVILPFVNLVLDSGRSFADHNKDQVQSEAFLLLLWQAYLPFRSLQSLNGLRPTSYPIALNCIYIHTFMQRTRLAYVGTNSLQRT